MEIFKKSLHSWLFWTILYLVILCRVGDINGKSYAGGPLSFSKRGTSSLGAELLLVQTIFRHGERNPQFLIPTDKENNISTWFQQTLGELTPMGMKEMFSLGEQFAQLYWRLLNPNLLAKQVYMRSTDRNRTLTSSIAFLNGFLNQHFGSINVQYFQPIPAHTIYGPSDSQFIEWLSLKSGIQNLTLDQLWKIVDPLTIEGKYPKLHPWPQWVNSSMLNKTQELVNFVTLRKYHRKSLARLRGGQLLGEIVDRMSEKIACSNTKNDLLLVPQRASSCSWIKGLKFYAYSAILYKNHYKTGLVPVWVSEGCRRDGTCQFLTFHQRCQQFIPDNWQQECRISLIGKTLGNAGNSKIRNKHSSNFDDMGYEMYNLSMSVPASVSAMSGNYLTKTKKKTNCSCSKDQKLSRRYKVLTFLFGTLFVISVLWNIFHAIRDTNISSYWNNKWTKLKVDENS